MIVNELSRLAFLNRIGDARLRVLNKVTTTDSSVGVFLLKFSAATVVAFDCDADASRSFAESFRHASEDDLIPQVRARLVAAKNPPAALVPDRVLVL